MFTIVFQRGYISILYQKYVINGKKLQYFGYMEQSVVLLLLLLLVFNRFFFDESFGNFFCGFFRVRGKSRPAAYQITRTHNLYLNGKL